MDNRGRVINIKDVIGYIIKHLIVALILMVIGAVALGGAYYLKNHTSPKAAEPQQETTNSEAEQIYSSLQKNEQVAADLAINDFEDYYQSFELLDNSIIEQIDSYNARKLYLTYSVEYVCDKDLSGEVQVSRIDYYSRLLYYYVVGGGLASDISEATDLDSSHIQDCITAEIFNGSGTLGINLWGTDVDERLEELLISCIDDYAASIADNTEVQIVLIQKSVSYARSEWIFNTQRAWEAEPDKIKARLDTAVANLTPNAYEYFKLTASNTYPEFYEYLYPQNNGATSVSTVSTKSLIKYAGIGAIAGFVLYGIYVLFLFMYSKKIVSMTDYTDTLKLRIIANVDSSMKELDVAATKITATCVKQNINEIALISVNESEAESYAKALAGKLKVNGITAKLLVGFLSDYKVMGELFDAGHCAIIEKLGSSIYSKVGEEVDLCNENNVNIIGLINIDK